jgi:hypothetical protein
VALVAGRDPLISGCVAGQGYNPDAVERVTQIVIDGLRSGSG